MERRASQKLSQQRCRWYVATRYRSEIAQKLHQTVSLGIFRSVAREILQQTLAILAHHAQLEYQRRVECRVGILLIREYPALLAASHARPAAYRLHRRRPAVFVVAYDAAKIISYYKRRWFIEDYHHLLKKKGFGIEDIQVESPHAFEINLAVSIKNAYEVALVKKGFDGNDDTNPASIAFTPLEIEIVDTLNRRFNTKKKIYKNPHPKGALAWASWVVACEGGWSAMPSQPKPGIITFKRGIGRLETIYQYLLENSNMGIFVGKG